MTVTFADLARGMLRAELARLGMTQQQLASEIRRAPNWVSRRLTGVTPTTMDDLDLMLRGMGYSAHEFLDELMRASARG